ncbi:hypothetical protein WKK05_39670 (plasmid) [Nostoc sp. UHCC 0302]|uniref:hypothetical protein n=1 Tax=Nostoc sp. UHCC 0302 TaxID=3134896 RepID=UPI00311CB047
MKRVVSAAMAAIFSAAIGGAFFGEAQAQAAEQQDNLITQVGTSNNRQNVKKNLVAQDPVYSQSRRVGRRAGRRAGRRYDR